MWGLVVVLVLHLWIRQMKKKEIRSNYQTASEMASIGMVARTYKMYIHGLGTKKVI